MSQDAFDEKSTIAPDMTILDVVSRHRRTEAVFKQYDEKVGVCICCEALFDPLSGVAEKYNLNLEKLITDLESAINVG